jgi:hypothetical protein
VRSDAVPIASLLLCNTIHTTARIFAKTTHALGTKAASARHLGNTRILQDTGHEWRVTARIRRSLLHTVRHDEKRKLRNTHEVRRPTVLIDSGTESPEGRHHVTTRHATACASHVYPTFSHQYRAGRPTSQSASSTSTTHTPADLTSRSTSLTSRRRPTVDHGRPLHSLIVYRKPCFTIVSLYLAPQLSITIVNA